MPLQVRSCTRLQWLKPISSAGNAGSSIFLCRDLVLVVIWRDVNDIRVSDHAFIPFAIIQDQHEYHSLSTLVLTVDETKLTTNLSMHYQLVIAC